MWLKNTRRVSWLKEVSYKIILWSFRHSILFLEAGVDKPNPRKRKKQPIKLGHGGTLDSAASGVLGTAYLYHTMNTNMMSTCHDIKSDVTVLQWLGLAREQRCSPPCLLDQR